MEFYIRMLHIGTLKSYDPASGKSALITQNGLCLKDFLQYGPVPITILLKDVIASEISFHTFQPFLNLTLKHSAAGKIRDQLGVQFSDYDTKYKNKNLKHFCILFDMESFHKDNEAT